MRPVLMVVAVVAIGAPACDGDDGGGADGGSGVDAAADATASTAFAVLVTETPPKASNEDPENWGGVRLFAAADGAAPLIAGEGIAPDALADPAGLAFRAEAREILVANRHGDATTGEATPSSIERFAYDPGERTLTRTGEITGGDLVGPHQLALSPSGELFAANRGGGISRFTFAADGSAIAGPRLGGNNLTTGVAVSPDGVYLYAAGPLAPIRRFDLQAGGAAVLAWEPEPGAPELLWSLAVHGDELYVAAIGTNSAIHRLAIGEGGALTWIETLDADAPTGIGFTPGGAMLVARSYTGPTGAVTRHERVGDAWGAATPVAELARPSGALLVIP